MNDKNDYQPSLPEGHYIVIYTYPNPEAARSNIVNKSTSNTSRLWPEETISDTNLEIIKEVTK